MLVQSRFVCITFCFYFYLYIGIDEVIQADLQVKVTHLIIRVLIQKEGLHYYQVTQ